MGVEILHQPSGDGLVAHREVGFASCSNERLSRFGVPTADQRSSTIGIFTCVMRAADGLQHGGVEGWTSSSLVWHVDSSSMLSTK